MRKGIEKIFIYQTLRRRKNVIEELSVFEFTSKAVQMKRKDSTREPGFFYSTFSDNKFLKNSIIANKY